MEVLARGGRWRSPATIAVFATIALVAAGASPAEAVPIKRGHTKLILNQNITSGMDFSIFPTPPAQARTGGWSFPITGGKVSRNGTGATINHGGGLRFVFDNGTVRVTRLEVHLKRAASEVRALIDGQRRSFLSLDGGRRTSGGRGVTFRGIRARLTQGAANALNRGSASNHFQRGMRLGQLRIQTTLAR